MKLKKLYYRMSNKEEFNALLEKMKSSYTSKFFFSKENSYFYCIDTEITKALILLNKAQWQLDNLVNSLSPFAKKHYIQSLIIDEIKATNDIENIYSTKQDIFSMLNEISENTKSKKIRSTISAYSLLLNENNLKIETLEDIRKIYDELLKDSLEKQDLPDGNLFRKNQVYITDGINIVHKGFANEDEINQGLDEFISYYNSNDYELYEKGIISHFLIETIHPFYDGNGRLGRFLLSSLIFNKTNSLSSFAVSTIIKQNKSKYYKMLKETRDIHEFGCLNDYLINFADMLSEGIYQISLELKQKLDILDNIEYQKNLTKSEKEIYNILAQGKCFTLFGLSNEEIINQCNISRRTLLSTIKKFKELDLIETAMFSKFTYHKLK